MGDKKRSSSNGMIRVGVVGVGRGQSFMEGAIEELGMELVAICDTWKEKLRRGRRKVRSSNLY